VAGLLRLREAVEPHRLERIHAPHQVRALRASATVADPANRRNTSALTRYRQPWQARSWELLDLVGEFSYVIQIHANSAQKVDTFPGIYMPGERDPVPIEDSDAARYANAAHEALDRLGGVDIRRDLARRVTENFQAAGECFLVGRTDSGDGMPHEVWEIRSTSEVDVIRDGKIIIRDSPASGPTRPRDSSVYELQPSDFIARMWVPHPRFMMQANSTARAAIEVLEELVILTKEVQADATSRIASRGIFVLPDTWMVQRADGIAATSAEDDPLLATLIEVGSEAIRDPGSAAAAMPIIMRAPADSTTQGKHYTFTSSDGASMAKRAEALGRFATMANLPKEALTGMATGNHWCVTEDHEILTEDGWVTHDRLSIGDTVLTLNHETGLSEWQSVERIYRADVVDEPMMHLAGAWHDSMTTLDHRWPVIRRADGARLFRTTRELTDEYVIIGSDWPFRWSTPTALAYTGTIWCPTTANATWLARRNGKAFYTGNSGWLVDDQRWRDHLDPGYRTVVDGLTAAYYRRHLAAAGVPVDVVARSVIWYDPAGAIIKSDRTEPAQKAYDRYAISSEAYRKHAGFADDDAPTDEERLSRAALEGVLDPASALAILQGREPPDPTAVVPSTPIAPDAAPASDPPAEGPPNGGVPPAEPSPSLAIDASAAMWRTLALAGARRPRPALTAAAPAPTPRPVRDRALTVSRRLAALDTQLRDTIRMAAEGAVRRALEKSGARLVTRVKRDSIAAAAIRDVPLWAVPCRLSALGPAVTAALGLDEHQTLESELATLALLWDRYVDEAQTQAIAEAAGLVGIEAASALARLGSTLQVDRAAGWDYLADQLARRAHDALTQDLAAEIETASLVPTGIVRAALAIAGGFSGGTSAGLDDTGRPVDPSETFGGVGTGRTVRTFLQDAGAELTSYQWVHGFTLNPFVPHEDLDGFEFTAWSDPTLSVVDAFPDVDGYYPGDHGGCSCTLIQMWAPPGDVVDADA
jgi:hypothetical protein